MEKLKECSDCKCKRSPQQFVWEGKHYKTCKICKDNRAQRKKDRLLDRIVNSLDNRELNQQGSFEILPEEGFTHATITAKNFEPEQHKEHESHIEVDYFDL
ncbi:hypothetical protein C2G38_2048042 [Gigaspora rosea]|uniref:Uncharacterized protein n=1 Tax=Gigaspora rosea TaxID=44941 RepID=A0A397U405_9GLOM|nr:hypothetical protein C2G38_2048042 [Gigaspora rosea]